MGQYRCVFIRHGDVSVEVVVEAKDDAHALVAADDQLANRPIYLSVEVFEGARRVARLERPAKATPH